VDLGSNPRARVKDLVRRATDAKYLEAKGSGRAPRVAGTKLAEKTIRTNSVTLSPAKGGRGQSK
jgi:hypothetical protein